MNTPGVSAVWGQDCHSRPSLRRQCQARRKGQASWLLVASDRNTKQASLNENGEREVVKGLRLKRHRSQRSGLLFMSSAADGENYSFEQGLDFCIMLYFQHPSSCLIFGSIRNNAVIIAHAFVPLTTGHVLSREIMSS